MNLGNSHRKERKLRDCQGKEKMAGATVVAGGRECKVSRKRSTANQSQKQNLA